MWDWVHEAWKKYSIAMGNSGEQLSGNLQVFRDCINEFMPKDVDICLDAIVKDIRHTAEVMDDTDDTMYYWDCISIINKYKAW